MKVVSSDLPVPPSYFFYDVGMNKSNAASLETIIEKSNKALDLDEVEKLQKNGAIIVDVRGN